MDNHEKRSVTIRISEFYSSNCSEEKYVRVTEKTEQYMRQWKLREESIARKNRRYKLTCFDEILTGECEGIYTPSHERDICCYTETELLHMAFDALPEYEKEIIDRYYFGSMKLIDLADKYGISKSSMGRHLEKARDMLKKIMLSYMQK